MRETKLQIHKRLRRHSVDREIDDSKDVLTDLPPGGIRALRWKSLAGWTALFVLFFVMLRPGIFITDTYGQYAEALSFTFHDWHPPLMAFLWSLLQPLAGASSMLLFHMLVYWGAFALMSDLCVREFHRFPLSLLVLSLLPTSLLHLPYVWKDTGLAVSVLGLLGCYCWLRRLPASRWGWLAAFLCAYYAVNVRHFALVAVFPILGMFIIPLRRIRKPTFRQWAVFLAAGLGIGFGLYLAGRAFDKFVLKSSPNTASHIQYFDIVGTLARAGAMREFPRELLPDPGKAGELEAAYWSDPYNADLYSAWGSAAGLVRVDTGDRINGPWLRTILAHPGAYLHHRLAFAGELLTETHPLEYLWAYVPWDGNWFYGAMRDHYDRELYHDKELAARAAWDLSLSTIFVSNKFSRLMAEYVNSIHLIYLPAFLLIVSVSIVVLSLVQKEYDLRLALSIAVVLQVICLCFIAPMTIDNRYLQWCYLATGFNLWLLWMRMRGRGVTGIAGPRDASLGGIPSAGSVR